MTRTYTGAEFMNTLAEGQLRSPIVREGMVKLDENGEGYDRRTLLFAEDASCESWLKVPVEIIDQVEYLATVRCKDHEHPLVRLSLKHPPGENQIARILGEFLLRAESRRQSGSMTEKAPCRPFRGPCKRNEDGAYTRYILYADCSGKEEPCAPPSAPGHLDIRIIERHQLGEYLEVSGSGFTPRGRVDLYADGLRGRTVPLAIGWAEADVNGFCKTVIDARCWPGQTDPATIRAVDQASNRYSVGQTYAYSCG